MLIDSHAHLTADGPFDNLDDILARAKEAGVTRICNICTDKTTLERGLALAEKHPWIVNVGATTPHDVEKEGELYFSLFADAARNGSLVAIGETGLDYHYAHSPKKIQQEFLTRYLELAEETSLPVVIHCRDAFADLFSLAAGSLLLHCFTGTKEEARCALDKGWLISFSGIVTFKKSTELQEVARYVPLDRMLIETDTPYLAPQSKRGKPNEPAYIAETAAFLATLKNLSVKDLASATAQNAMEFFGLQ